MHYLDLPCTLSLHYLVLPAHQVFRGIIENSDVRQRDLAESFALRARRGGWRVEDGGVSKCGVVGFVVMSRNLPLPLRSAVSSAKSLLPQALWVVLHLFLWTRSFGKAVVDTAFRVLGLAFLEPRRGLHFCWRKLWRIARIRSFAEAWYERGGSRPPPPETLAVIVNDRDDAASCLPQIANVLVWAAEAGIRHVSVYDQDGLIRSSTSKLAELVVKATVTAEMRGKFPQPASLYAFRRVKRDGEIKTVERFQCGGAATATTPRKRDRAGRGTRGKGDTGDTTRASENNIPPSNQNTPTKNTSTCERSLTTVDLLGCGDGAAGLLECARRWGDETDGALIASATEKQHGKPARVEPAPGPNPNTSHTAPTTPAQIERWLDTNNALLPAVDVLVVFGPHFHVAGYPPWQLHKAEMYHRRSIGFFTRDGLREVLSKYAGVSKRNGR